MYSGQAGLWGMAFIIVNLYSWWLFYSDKRKAQQRSAFRIPESSFFWVAICGGGAGAFLAMLLFRHKTKHLSFKAGLPVLFVLSLGIFLWGLNRMI